LKWRLVWGGLFCAILAGLSGGAGILSLCLIQSSIEEITFEMRSNISTQITQITQLYSIRTLVNEIAEVRTDDELNQIIEKLDCVSQEQNEIEHKNRDGRYQYTENILEAVSALLIQKRKHLRSSTEIEILRKKIEATTQEIINRFEGIESYAGDDLEAFKAAMTLPSYCNQLTVAMNEALSKYERYFVKYCKFEIEIILDNFDRELSRLPGECDGLKEGITKYIDELEKDLSCILEAKSNMIEVDNKLDEIFLLVNKRLSDRENSIKTAGRIMISNAEKSLLSSTNLVKYWQYIEFTLVCLAFFLAAVIGVGIFRSVSKPLQLLNEGIIKFGEGNLDHKLDTQTKDEIGQLSRVFDQMTDKLSTRDNEIRFNEQRFRGLFENSNDGIVIHDKNAKVLDVNKRMLEITGYHRNSFLKMSLPDLHVREERSKIMSLFENADEGTVINLESQYLKADNTVIKVEILSSLAEVGNGAMQTVVRDITEHKRNEEELKQHMKEISQANQRLEVLVSNTADREKMMVQLKAEVNELRESIGLDSKYEAPLKVAGLVAGIETNRRDNV